MKIASPINAKEMLRITICLAITCLVAGGVLGIVYNFTEPTKQINAAQREMALVHKLLRLKSEDKIIEVRRYISEEEPPLVDYSVDGKFLGAVKDLSKSHEAGRFFIGKDASGKVAGYVTEASQYGFKSSIRFFVALTPAFQIQGVEVISHEEDPGLGAEITKPLFKDQFIGLEGSRLQEVKVVKGPMPGDPAVREPDAIYAVTGATISSRALTEGVKKAVSHLQKRLPLVLPNEGNQP